MKLEKLLVLGCVALGMALTGCAPADDGDENTDCNPFVDLDCDPGTGGADKLQVSGTIATTTTWTLSQCPVRVTGDLYIEGAGNPVLTIPAGCEVRIDPGYGIYVSYSGGSGGLKAIGTADKPIVFTSSQPTKSAGDWDEIGIYGNASDGDLRFENVFIEFGGGGSQGSVHVDDAKPVFVNAFITDSGADGMTFVDEGQFGAASSGVSVTDNAGFGVSINAGVAASVPETGSSFARNAFGAVKVTGGTLSQSGTWADLGDTDAYIVTGDVYVEGAGTPVLTIGAGTTIKFNPSYGLYVSYSGGAGGLITQGTSSAPVLLTTSAPSPAAGSWDGIGIYANAADGSLRFEYTTIEYAGQTSQGGLYVDDATIVMINSTVRQNNGVGIFFDDGAFFGTGSTALTVTGSETYGLSVRAQSAGSIPEAGSSYTGNTGGAVQVRGGTVATSSTWGDIGGSYIVSGDLYVEGVGNPVLTIDAGVTVAFNAGYGLYVSYSGQPGGLTVLDDALKPATTFTSSAPSPTKGSWDGLHFYGNTSDGSSVLTDIVVNYAGAGMAALYTDDAKVTVNGAVIKNSSSWGIKSSCGVAGNGPILTNVTYGAGAEANTSGDFSNSGC